MQRIDNPMAKEPTPEPYFRSRAARDSVGEGDIGPDDAAQHEAEKYGECVKVDCPEDDVPSCKTCHGCGFLRVDHWLLGEEIKTCPDCGTGKAVQE